MANLTELTGYLDRYLEISSIPDDPKALNGLQVEAAGEVRKVTAAVDACQATIDAAANNGSDLIIVHHGLFWGGLEPVTGRLWRRLVPLIENNIALYSAHLPLDYHSEVGNNNVLATKLGLTRLERFGDYQGLEIGVAGYLDASLAELAEKIELTLGVQPQVLAKGGDEAGLVGVITGGGGSMIAMAKEAGIDTLVTGEGAHHTFFDAEELEVNVIYAGHYATETVGVKALAQHLAGKFGLDWNFFDHPTGL